MIIGGEKAIFSVNLPEHIFFLFPEPASRETFRDLVDLSTQIKLRDQRKNNS